MKKTLIALATLGAIAGVAHAQSNVTVYGTVDIGYVKETNKKMKMDNMVDERLGFMGSEDLGNGLKATFQLEKRFNLQDGTATNAIDFEGASNLGLAGSFGHVRFGRLNNLTTETIRQFDPFDQYGVGGMFRNSIRESRIANSVRYDSPNWNGFQLGATYTLENPGALTSASSAGKNAGYGLTAKYNNGPLSLAADYNKKADSYDSTNWNVAAAYAFGPAKVSALYEKASVKTATTDLDQKIWLVGAEYKIGAGKILASYGQIKDSTVAGEPTNKKYAIGYNHSLSKRTTAYAHYAHTKYDLGQSAYGGEDAINGFQVGLTHKF
ncbi:MAG: Outer rane porin protein 32 [Burkholderiaceae bacterium]|nr:Outer rane porin protein 32 [Burkholderiaceae bacterium]